MAQRSKSSKAYLERAGIISTIRGPLPTAAPGRLPVMRTKVSPPLPKPELLQNLQGSPPPDRGTSTRWPHG